METKELKVGDYVKLKHKPAWGLGKVIAYWPDLEHPIAVQLYDYRGCSVVMGFRDSGLIKITEADAMLLKLTQ